MSKVKMSKTYGIHTIELYAKALKYTDVQRVIDRLMDTGKIQQVGRDPYNIDRQFKSTYFVEDGLRLRIHQSHNKSNGIGFIINPSTLLTGKYHPLGLWIPTQTAAENMLKQLAELTDNLWSLALQPEDFSLCQMDITYNKRLGKDEEDLSNIIRNYRKGLVPRNYKRYKSKDTEEKQHFFAIYTHKTMFKVYDKVYELEQNDRCPKDLRGDKILRCEVSMKREAFLKKLGLNRDDSLYSMLAAGYLRGNDILNEYLHKLDPCSGEWVSYNMAQSLIKHSIKDEKLQEQMLYLLKKTSDSAGLSTATQKLKERYKDVDNRRMKKIFAEFDKLGISPITLPKN